jgi:hypothetical protein
MKKREPITPDMVRLEIKDGSIIEDDDSASSSSDDGDDDGEGLNLSNGFLSESRYTWTVYGDILRGTMCFYCQEISPRYKVLLLLRKLISTKRRVAHSTLHTDLLP